MKIKQIYAILIFTLIIFGSSYSIFANQIENNHQIVSVRQFMKDFKNYSKKEVKIEGVVSKIYKKRNLIGLIDVQELRECGVVTCAQLTLPVRWNGSMPQIKSIVRVLGVARKEKAGFVFVANNLTIEESKQNVK